MSSILIGVNDAKALPTCDGTADEENDIKELPAISGSGKAAKESSIPNASIFPSSSKIFSKSPKKMSSIPTDASPLQV
jgi:hypothetical protein